MATCLAAGILMEAVQVRPTGDVILTQPAPEDSGSNLEHVKSRLARIPLVPSSIIIAAKSSSLRSEPARSSTPSAAETFPSEALTSSSTEATSILELPGIFSVQKIHVSPNMQVDEKIRAIWTRQIRPRLGATLLHSIPTGTCVQEFMMASRKPNVFKPALIITCGDRITKKRVEKTFKSQAWLQELLKANGIMFIALVAKTTLSDGPVAESIEILARNNLYIARRSPTNTSSGGGGASTSAAPGSSPTALTPVAASSSSTSTGAIIGIVVGVLVAIAAGLFAFHCFRRRRLRKRRDPAVRDDEQGKAVSGTSASELAVMSPRVSEFTTPTSYIIEKPDTLAYLVSGSERTSCGLTMIINKPFNLRRCTLGGLLVVNGKIMGLTAGHPFESSRGAGYISNYSGPYFASHDVEDYNGDGGSNTSDEPFVFNDGTETSNDSTNGSKISLHEDTSAACQQDYSTPPDPAESLELLPLSNLYCRDDLANLPLPLSALASPTEGVRTCLDWALIESLPAKQCTVPNKVTHVDPRDNLLIKDMTSGPVHGEITVVLADIGPQKGYLHASPVTLKVNQTVLDVQLITLEHNLSEFRSSK